MNVPPNVREFDIDLAQQNHPLVTRDGTPVEFIALVENVLPHHKVVVKIRDEVYKYPVSGESFTAMSNWDLFLAPLGYCEGKPVFANDILVSYYGTEYAVGMQDTGVDFELSKWPSKAPQRINVRNGKDFIDCCKCASQLNF